MNDFFRTMGSFGFVACVFAMTALTAGGCGDDGGGTGGEAPDEETAAEAMCKAAVEAASSCGEGTCDAAIAADCEDVASILSDPFLRSARTCLEDGGTVATCFVEALGGLEPGAAQATFAQRFCDDCALGAPGCDQIAGAASAFGDDLLGEIADTCFSGLTCVPSLASCVQTVLVARAIPEEAATCLATSLFSGEPPPEDVTCK